MKTYQDLEVIIGDIARGEFCKDAVEEFKQSRTYAEALAGEMYYNKHNVTIEHYQKTIRTLSGGQRYDDISANYKLKTLFFRRLVLQQVSYVLGNGLTLTEPANKEKLGDDFDIKLITCAKRAMASGVAFGFWNLDHLEVFGYADTPSQAGFCPLYDQFTSKLRAGIRFWFRKVGNDEIFRATLYEEDGYTEYQINDKEVTILSAKRGYIRNTKQTQDGRIEDIIDQNYGTLPIIPLYANDSHESELVGIRECIDCYDFIKSGLANNIDDSSELYWILTNTGGMDDVDLAQFLQRLKTVHATAVDGDQNVNAEAHTIQIPTEARATMLELLRKDIYEDFQALDVNTLSASAKTTQEIQASYQSQDNKCADFEYFVIDFVKDIMALAGINDTPSFVWNRVVNQQEQTQMLLMCANILPADVIIRHLPFLDPDEADDVIKQNTFEEYALYNSPNSEDSGEDEEITEEDKTTAEIEE